MIRKILLSINSFEVSLSLLVRFRLLTNSIIKRSIHNGFYKLASILRFKIEFYLNHFIFLYYIIYIYINIFNSKCLVEHIIYDTYK